MLDRYIVLLSYSLDLNYKKLLPRVYSQKRFFVLCAIFFSILGPKKLRLGFFVGYSVGGRATDDSFLYRLLVNISSILRNGGFFIRCAGVTKKVNKFTVLRSVFADKKSREQLSRPIFSLVLITGFRRTHQKAWKYYDSYINTSLQGSSLHCSLTLIRTCENH